MSGIISIGFSGASASPRAAIAGSWCDSTTEQFGEERWAHFGGVIRARRRTVDSEKLREKFEAHWSDQTKGGDGSWTTLERLAAQEAYRAAYLAGLRDAAGICRQERDGFGSLAPASSAELCAIAILSRADEMEKGR
jgi:hypothetical protein